MTTRERVQKDRPNRGQTTIDFAVGVGLFLITVAFVMATVPGMIEPFAHDQDDPLVADRVASQLAEGHLGDPDSPGILNQTCTVEFFAASGTTCGFDAAKPVNDQLNLGTRTSLNVTLRRTVSGGDEPEILCLDGDDVQSCGAGGTPMARGGETPETAGTVVSARRTVHVDDRDALLVVKTW